MVDDGSVLAAEVERRLRILGYVANGVGAVVALGYAGLVASVGSTTHQSTSVIVRNVVVFAVYLAVTLPVGSLAIHGGLYRPIARWLRTNEPAGADDQLAVLRFPVRWTQRVVVPWAGALPLFVLLNLHSGARLIASACAAIVLGAVLAAALQYLLVEQAMRPITARALSGAVPSGELTPGVTARLVMAWTVGAGVPLVGIAAVGATASLGRGLSRDRVAGACAVLALIGVLAGSLAIRLASRSVAIPLYGLRDGLASVAAGRLDQTVRVDDGSEVGRLQAGFNSMIEGLRDRQRLHDAFGSYVDPDLTRRILTEGVDLAGEEIELSVMFIDVRDFTVFAEATPAREVVAQLNSLYAVIIPIITRNGGHASKFVGDGLLAVFGAPRRLDHHADDAVRCAIEMVDAVSTDATIGLQVGIGVNSGSVVVGTVGGGGRRDFTVIGDTVNTAARVESATRQTGDDILITDSTRRLLTVHGEWRARPLVQLKGKSGSVTLYAPEQ